MRAVTVLGSGNAYFEDGRGHASFLVEGDGGTALLVDAGATALLRMREHALDRDRIDGILITHFHGDHLLGLPPLLLDLRTFSRRTRSLVVAGPRGIGDAVGRLVDAAFPGFDPGFGLAFVELEDRATTRIGGWELEPRAQTHRPESLGYRVREGEGPAIAFSGDCTFDGRLVDLVEGAGVAFVEVALPGGPDPEIAHVALDEMLARHGELRAERLVFTHVNDRIASALEHAGIGTVARDGLRVAIDRPGGSPS